MAAMEPTRQPPADGSPLGGAQLTSQRTARDPADLRRLLLFLLVTMAGLVAATAARRTTAGVEADLVGLLGSVPKILLGVVVLATEVLHLLVFLAIPGWLLATRQWWTLLRYASGYLTTLLLSGALLRAAGPEPAAAADDRSLDLISDADWLSPAAVGAAVTALVLLSPKLNRPWRRFGWGFVGLLALIDVVMSSDQVEEVLLSVGVGGSVGYAMLLAFGRRITVPTTQALAAGLAQIGLPGSRVSVVQHTAEGSLWCRATAPDGSQLHCRVLTARGYQSDKLLRTYRRVRVREVGEEVPYSTVRRAAAMESMLASAAHAAGVRTPTVRGITALSDSDMVIAFDQIDGTGLDQLDPERMSDDVLHQAWLGLAGLRRAGIAHRDLHLGTWVLDGEERVWLLDFSFGEPVAGAGALSADIAELLAATYPVVGAERAVAAAIEVLGPQTLAEGLTHLVPAALTRPTRTALKAVPEGLEPLVARAAAACRVAEPQFAAIERFKPRTLVVAALLAAAVYVLLPQLADLPAMLAAIREADTTLLASAALSAAVMFAGSGLALLGSIQAPVRYLHSLLTAISANFVGAIAPPTVARVGVSVRFAQKQGLPAPVAVSAAAAKELAVGAVHLGLLLAVALIAGRSDALQGGLDAVVSGRAVAIGIAVGVAAVSVAFAVPRIRALLRDSLLPGVRRSVGAVRDLAADPARMVALFLGALLLQLGFIGALYLSVRAVGGETTLITIALLYLTVGAAATIAPTPGGIGAVEAVLLAALTGVGVDPAEALAGVFLYRLLTFWLPIPIGALCMRYLTSRDLL